MNADLTLFTALLPGALFALGAVLVAAALRPAPPRLDDALAVLDGRATVPARPGWSPPWLARMRLNGTTARDLLTDKLVFAGIGLVTPGVLAGCAALLLGWSPLLPAGVALLGGIVGFFVPDLRAHRRAGAARRDYGEAVFTYIDLVTLERLANRSATQALTDAAALSDHALFVELRRALDRARLEQRSPFPDLIRLAEELRLPGLADVADVMRLDETGAALSGLLRARVRELRDARLTDERIAAHAVSERMTVWMAVPSLVFALIFLTPPLLRLLG